MRATLQEYLTAGVRTLTLLSGLVTVGCSTESRPIQPLIIPAAEQNVEHARLRRLVDELNRSPIRHGSRRGLGYAAVVHNRATQAVVREAEPIVPYLIANLEQCNRDGAILTVFCLNQLKAKQAEDAVLRLRETAASRFPAGSMTLSVQIRLFLREVCQKPSE